MTEGWCRGEGKEEGGERGGRRETEGREPGERDQGEREARGERLKGGVGEENVPVKTRRELH